MPADLTLLRAARSRLELGLVRREVRLSNGLPRSDVLWELLSALGETLEDGVPLIVTDQDVEAFRILLIDEEERLVALVRDPLLIQLLADARLRGRPLVLDSEAARHMAKSAPVEQADRLQWFYLVPVDVEEFFSGFLGVALPGRGSPDGTDPDARLRLMTVLRGARPEMAAFLRHAAIREEVYLAGLVNESIDLAFDMHDSVLQDLSWLQLQLERVARELPANSKAQQLLDEARSNTLASTGQLRQLLGGLVISAPAQGLSESLAELLVKLGDRFEGATEFVTHGPPRSPGAPVARQVARVCQEALNNVVKHARAEHVRVDLTYDADVIRVQVTDDGRGFDQEHIDGGRLGFASMRRRVRKLGGALTIEGQVGKGTVVTATIAG